MNFTTIPEMFIKICEKYGDSKTSFMFTKGGKYTGVNYNELREKVETFALGLLNLGIHSKDRIGLVSENRLEWAIADLAITSIGAIDIPIFSTLSAKQEEYIFSDCQATAIIVSNKYQLSKVLEFKDNIPSLRHIIVMNKDFGSQDVFVKSMDYIMNRGCEIKSPEERRSIIEELSAKVLPEDILTIIYTSGTTGNPKGVMQTHRNVVSNIIAAVETVGFKDTDVFLNYLPWCHSYERTTGYYAAFSAGALIALAESLETIAANIKEIKPTLMTTVPRLLEIVKKKIIASIENESIIKQKIFNWSLSIGSKYIRSKLNRKTNAYLLLQYKLADSLVFSKIRENIGVQSIRFFSGGAPLPDDVCEFFLSLGYLILEGYGLTEASPVVAVTVPEFMEIGTVGRPMYNVEVKIAADGEILVRGPNVMKGYWGDEQATLEAIDEEGWLYTGDVGYITEKGNIKITDRKKNIFISSGGKNIAPQPIENLLSQSPYIEQCILIGEKREYCTALITPDFVQLKKLADNFGLDYRNPSELISFPQIVRVIQMDIDRIQKDLAKFERVRKFSLLSMPFSIENGELTPKLSIKRHVVERKYSDLIDQMYDMK